MSIKRIFKDPLSHFLIAGLAIYVALSFGEQYEDNQNIVITRDTLIEFVQARSRIFDESLAIRRLEQMSNADIHDLIQQFEREEALYREAQQLGLDQGDYVIRQRLVGKMEFLTNRDLAIPDPGDAELGRFFESNLQDYVEPAAATFTHVFLSGENAAGAELERNARDLLEKLVVDAVEPDTAQIYGDRFLFHTHYVDRDRRFVAAELGWAAADEIFSEESPKGRWFGPVLSDHGAHLVFLAERSPSRTPALADVRNRVVDDFARLERLELQAALEETIVSAYRIEISPDLMRWIDEKGARLGNQLLSLSAGSSN